MDISEGAGSMIPVCAQSSVCCCTSREGLMMLIEIEWGHCVIRWVEVKGASGLEMSAWERLTYAVPSNGNTERTRDHSEHQKRVVKSQIQEYIDASEVVGLVDRHIYTLMFHYSIDWCPRRTSLDRRYFLERGEHINMLNGYFEWIDIRDLADTTRR